jgi:PAS domain S-box-containing protein
MRKTRCPSSPQVTPAAWVRMDASGVIRFVSRQAELLFGYDGDDLGGQPIETLIPEPVCKIYEEYWRQGCTDSRARARGLDLVRSGRRRDGNWFSASINLSHVDTRHGLSVIAEVRDMTNYHVGQEDRRRLDRLAAIVEYSDDAIIGTTLDGIVLSWNPAAERLYGYSSQEMIGKFPDAVTPKDRTGEIQAILAKISAGQSVKHLETRRVRKDGTLFPVSLTVSPFCDADGVMTGASVIARDITEQEHAARYARSLIEAGLDPMVTISPEGKINDVNEATVKVTGVPREKLIGTSFSHYFTDPDKAEEIYQRVLTQGVVTDYPLTLRRHDGQEAFTEVLYNASLYRNSNGNVLGVFAAARDVTKQVQAQKELADQQIQEQDRLAELERFKELVVGRELKMIELKKEIEYLRKHGPTNAGEPEDQH